MTSSTPNSSRPSRASQCISETSTSPTMSSQRSPHSASFRSSLSSYPHSAPKSPLRRIDTLSRHHRAVSQRQCHHGRGHTAVTSAHRRAQLPPRHTQLFRCAVTDDGCRQICDIFKTMRYPPNEVTLSQNALTDIGFQLIVDFIAHRHSSSRLSYPLRPYRVKFEGVIQSRVPLWLRVDHNHIDVQAARTYMAEKEVSVCLARNHQSKKPITAHGTYTKTSTLCCDAQCCVCDEVVDVYNKALS